MGRDSRRLAPFAAEDTSGDTPAQCTGQRQSTQLLATSIVSTQLTTSIVRNQNPNRRFYAVAPRIVSRDAT